MQLTRRLISGLSTFLPGGALLTERATGGTASARYCYWVWLHHVLLAQQNGLLSAHPSVVAELGPGDSLGAGLAALLAGANRYYAFDVIEYADCEANLEVLEQLIGLFQRRTPVTDDEFTSPMFDLRKFPEDMLTSDLLGVLLAPDRLEAIQRAVRWPGQEHCDIQVAYQPRWSQAVCNPEARPQLLFSQAVLEHVDDLPGAYDAMRRWLPPNAVMSHEIDFRSHAFARTWNGHWTYSDRAWRLIRGRRRYAINREPLSTHLALMSSHGFRVVDVRRLVKDSELRRAELAPRFRSLDEQDLTTRTALIQAVREDSATSTGCEGDVASTS